MYSAVNDLVCDLVNDLINGDNELVIKEKKTSLFILQKKDFFFIFLNNSQFVRQYFYCGFVEMIYSNVRAF